MKLAIIIGSARQPRRSGPVAEHVYQYAKEHTDFSEVELLDVAKFDFKLDIPSGFDGAPDRSDPVTKAWSEKITSADAFIFVMPEHNYGYSAALKLAIDYLYEEWAHKPVAFVAHGGVGGARVIENILPVVRAVQMVPLKADVRFNSWGGDLDPQGNVIKNDDAPLLDKQLKFLYAYAQALEPLREQLR